MGGYQFMRQKPILNYIVDFYCSILKLIIEIDGDSHDCKYDEDSKRQNDLESLGLKLIRFTDNEVKNSMTDVLSTIENYIYEFEKK